MWKKPFSPLPTKKQLEQLSPIIEKLRAGIRARMTDYSHEMFKKWADAKTKALRERYRKKPNQPIY